MTASLYRLADGDFIGQETYKVFQIRFVQWDTCMPLERHLYQRLIKNEIQKTIKSVVNKRFLALERVMNSGCLRYSGYRSTGQ